MTASNDLPAAIPIGSSVRLVELNSTAAHFFMSVEAFRLLLSQLSIPTLTMKGHEFINIFALEQMIFFMMEPGANGLDLNYPEDNHIPKALVKALRDPTSALHAQRAMVGMSNTYSDVRALRRRLLGLSAGLLRPAKVAMIKGKEKNR